MQLPVYEKTKLFFLMGFQNISVRYSCALGTFEKQIKPHYIVKLGKWDVTQFKNGLSGHFFYAKTPQ